MKRIDELKRCPKCGYPEFYYHFSNITERKERIETKCKRCDYQEDCLPLDAIVEKNEV